MAFGKSNAAKADKDRPCASSQLIGSVKLEAAGADVAVRTRPPSKPPQKAFGAGAILGRDTISPQASTQVSIAFVRDLGIDARSVAPTVRLGFGDFPVVLREKGY